MPTNTVKNWLLCYDIANPRRLASVHRYVKNIAIPLQYSVFQLTANNTELQHIINDLEQIISLKEDDIRIYPMHKKPKIYIIGSSTLQEGVLFINNQSNLLK